MRRIGWVGVVLAAGCTSDPDVAFVAVSELAGATRGLVLRDGAIADAAMADQVCVLDVRGGVVIGDTDLGEGTDRLLDAYGDRALGALPGRVAVLAREPGAEPLAAWEVEVVDGRLVDGGVVLVSAGDGCTVTWIEEEPRSWSVPGLDCADGVGLAVDPVAGTAWIADGSALARVDPDGRFERWDGVAADLVLRGPSGDLLLGERGGDWLESLSDGGDARWSALLDGPLVDAAVAPGTELAGVVVADGRGRSDLVLYDLASGWDVADHPLPAEVEVAFSGDGGTMALTGDLGVHFYDVDVDRGALDVPDAPAGAGHAEAAAGLGLGAVVGTAAVVALMAD